MFSQHAAAANHSKMQKERGKNIGLQYVLMGGMEGLKSRINAFNETTKDKERIKRQRPNPQNT